MKMKSLQVAGVMVTEAGQKAVGIKFASGVRQFSLFWSLICSILEWISFSFVLILDIFNNSYTAMAAFNYKRLDNKNLFIVLLNIIIL